VEERCELCGLPLANEHAHLFERERRTIVCACDACGTLFGLIDAATYRRINPAVRRLSHVTLDDAAWSSLGVPVGLAFLSRTASGDIVAAYPGPAGATLAGVDRAAWESVVARHRELADLEPDVEAWLVNRIDAEPRQYRVSIDHCYRLAGLVRSRWTGIGGGPPVAEAITAFFHMLDEHAA
jgi:Family of unknown function (DUF5947)